MFDGRGRERLTPKDEPQILGKGKAQTEMNQQGECTRQNDRDGRLVCLRDS